MLESIGRSRGPGSSSGNPSSLRVLFISGVTFRFIGVLTILVMRAEIFEIAVSLRGIEPWPGGAVTVILTVTKPFSATWIG